MRFPGWRRVVASFKVLEERQVNSQVFLHIGSGRQLLRRFRFAIIRMRVDHVQRVNIIGLYFGQVECSRGIYAPRKKH